MIIMSALSRRWRRIPWRLSLRLFDSTLQGALLAVLLLETCITLLLRRTAGTGFVSSFLEDYVTVAAGATEFILAVGISWMGRHRRQCALASCLMVTTASALVVFAFPFSKTDQEPKVELCGQNTIPDYKVDVGIEPLEQDNFAFRTAFLLISAIMCLITKLSIWAHGLTYLDDHESKNGPFYYGFLISIRLSIGLSAQNWLRSVSMREEWWKCYLTLCLLPLLFAAVFFSYPRKLKKDLEDDWISDFSDGFVRVIKNKLLMFLTFAIAFLELALFSITQYDVAYVQGRFHMEAYRQNPRASRAISDIFRPLVILFFIMIFRVRFSVRREDGVKASTAARVGGVISLVVVVIMAVISALSCTTGDIEGEASCYVQPPCSMHCGCSAELYGYSPVCGLDFRETYFSPCHAGCDEYEDLNGFILFRNCTCGMQRAVRGSCSINDCNVNYSVYQVLYTVLLAVAGSGLLMQGMAVLRSVRDSDKPLAIGVSFAFIALIKDVVGRLLYMMISNATCAYATSDACVFHHSTIWIIPATSAVLAFFSALISFTASTLKISNIVD